jgi:hypothetical protein
MSVLMLGRKSERNGPPPFPRGGAVRNRRAHRAGQASPHARIGTGVRRYGDGDVDLADFFRALQILTRVEANRVVYVVCISRLQFLHAYTLYGFAYVTADV